MRCEQFAGDTGVFTGDKVGAAQGFNRSLGDIAQISDRRCDDF